MLHVIGRKLELISLSNMKQNENKGRKEGRKERSKGTDGHWKKD